MPERSAESGGGGQQPVLESNALPIRPKVVVSSDNFEQPRRVEWGHLSQVRGTVVEDNVRIVRQGRKHTFGQGTHDHGRARPLFEAPLQEALDVYRALDALFTGGALEVDDGE